MTKYVPLFVSSKQQASQVSAWTLTSLPARARAAGTAMPSCRREKGTTKLCHSGAAQTCGDRQGIKDDQGINFRSSLAAFHLTKVLEV